MIMLRRIRCIARNEHREMIDAARGAFTSAAREFRNVRTGIAAATMVENVGLPNGCQSKSRTAFPPRAIVDFPACVDGGTSLARSAENSMQYTKLAADFGRA
jgi:hypothetical protein